jgi:hypothetical protein
MLAMIREFKDGAPCGTLEKINTVRNDFGHPLARGWRDKYSSSGSKVEVLQLLIVGIKTMRNIWKSAERIRNLILTPRAQAACHSQRSE